MIKIDVTAQPLLSSAYDGYAFFLPSNFDFEKCAAKDQKFYPPLKQAFADRRFTGKAGSSLILSGIDGARPVTLIFLGIGDQHHALTAREMYRRAVGQLIRIVESIKIKTVGMELPDITGFGISSKRCAQETATILHKASYHFDEFFSSPERKLAWDCIITLNVQADLVKDVQAGVADGEIIAGAINDARYLCDMPPSRLTPTILAQHAEKVAQENKLKATIFDKAAITKMGMGGILGVSRGSDEECRLAILEYTADKKDAPTVVIVGKGITFDSGGLSIKPAAAMETMKDDMAGAAVVISTMKVLAKFKPEVNVIALAPMSENMTGGSAQKPGDVVRFYNGKTAEVLNTDAEGRLILADALSYAVKHYKADAIIDLATLTGACAYALGPFYAGLLSQHDELAARVEKAAASSGDKVWRLPMDDDFKPAVRSDIADLNNSGNAKYKAGAITAAFFLQPFVDKVPWVHLDIAGTAFGVPDLTYLRPGATGFGIRLLTDLIMNWNK